MLLLVIIEVKTRVGVVIRMVEAFVVSPLVVLLLLEELSMVLTIGRHFVLIVFKKVF